MSVNEFVSLNTAKDPELRMTAQLAVHCAPILKDAKAANILTVAEADFKGIGYLLQGTGISYRFLETAGEKAILYLYRKKRLQDILRDSRILALFGSYGWGNQEWMRDWEDRIQADGATVLNGEGITVNGAPGEDTLEECRSAGRGLAGMA